MAKLTAADMNRYADVLQQIRIRLDIVDDLLRRRAPTPEEDLMLLEHAALNIRQVLELIALSTLVTNRVALEGVTKALEKHDPNEALKRVKAVNPGFWPAPVRRVPLDTSVPRPPGATGRGFQWVGVTERVLHESEWGPAYGMTSSLLHARNPLRPALDLANARGDLRRYARLTRALMTEHVVPLAGGKTTVAGVLDSGDGKSSTGLMEVTE